MLSPDKAEPLLQELCTRLGVCLPPEARASLLGAVPQDRAGFTDMVLSLEGLRFPPPRLRREVAEVVDRAYERAARGDWPSDSLPGESA
jgi:hypothetical protein